MRASASPEVIARGWSAADVDPSEYVDDAWIAAHTRPMRRPSTVRHAAAKTRNLLLQRGGLTRDQMRRIAARTGYPVVEAWSPRDAGPMSGVWGALCHHTGSDWSAPGDYPTLRVVMYGRSDLQNSLCAFGIGKSGTIYLVSEKLSWHAGAGAWNGLTDGNGYMAGIEAESDGVHWADGTVDCYPRLVASILVEINQDDRYTTRHASYALPPGRKTDFSNMPGGDDAFWAQIYAYLADPEQINRNQPAPAPAEEDDDMPCLLVFNDGDHTVCTRDGAGYQKLADPATIAKLRAAGYKPITVSSAEHENWLAQSTPAAQS